MDAGTAFEIGFMHALGKPMVGWTRDARSYPDKVRAFFAITFGLDLVADAMPGAGGRSGSLRDPDGILVHSEGCLQNAMVPAAIEMTGGTVCADADWRRAF
jgi:nucleoside 2-deoxyribosyltransferase